MYVGSRVRVVNSASPGSQHLSYLFGVRLQASSRCLFLFSTTKKVTCIHPSLFCGEWRLCPAIYHYPSLCRRTDATSLMVCATWTYIPLGRRACTFLILVCPSRQQVTTFSSHGFFSSSFDPSFLFSAHKHHAVTPSFKREGGSIIHHNVCLFPTSAKCSKLPIHATSPPPMQKTTRTTTTPDVRPFRSATTA